MHIGWTSRIEISKKALKNNLRFIKKMIGPQTIFCSVVKGNAYGHGIYKYVPLAQECGVNFFAVFSSHEAAQVLAVKKPETRLMIMGMIDLSELEWAISNDIEFYVFDFERLKASAEAAQKLGKCARIHVEVETGMNRTGFAQKDWPALVELLRKHNNELVIEGLCTHYAGAESIANYLRIQNQFEVFSKAKEYFRESEIPVKIYHTACSAALLRYPDTQMDLVRVGILQYGYWPSNETYVHYVMNNGKTKGSALKGLITWKSKVMDIKEVESGEFVSYGTSFLASKKMKIASVPVGYSDGFSRSLSNRGRVLIHGKRCSVIGMVNMNMMLIDVTDVKDVQREDEVVLIGQQRKLKINVSSFEDIGSFVNYELLTRLPHDISRDIVD